MWLGGYLVLGLGPFGSLFKKTNLELPQASCSSSHMIPIPSPSCCVLMGKDYKIIQILQNVWFQFTTVEKIIAMPTIYPHQNDPHQKEGLIKRLATIVPEAKASLKPCFRWGKLGPWTKTTSNISKTRQSAGKESPVRLIWSYFIWLTRLKPTTSPSKKHNVTLFAFGSRPMKKETRADSVVTWLGCPWFTFFPHCHFPGLDYY